MASAMDTPYLPLLLFPLAAILLIRILEVADGSRAVSAGWRHEALRIGVHATAYGAVFVLVWRPLLALLIVGGGMIVLFAANRIKRRVAFEPIVFSDLALLGQIVRHPHLYYISRLALTGGGVGLAAIVAILAAVEMPRPGLLWISAFAALAAAATWAGRSRVLDIFGKDVLDERTGWGTKTFGLPAALVLQWLGWLSSPPPAWTNPAPAEFDGDADLIVMQLESYADLPERMEGRSTPFWRDLKARSSWHGPLEVTIKGANTMRTEHAVISGVANTALGFDRFDPYLRPALGKAWPLALQAQGWHTAFIHPNDLRFFRRDSVLPKLGFRQLVAEEDFVSPERVGRYVSDAALVGRLIDELDRMTAPGLVFAVTMENHGPWKADRLPGVDAGIAGYRHHMFNLERALDRLLRHLEHRERRTILVLYGDHLPTLPETAGWSVLDTDYLIFDTEGNAGPGDARRLAPERLLETALSTLRR